jgi:hypothetical protein
MELVDETASGAAGTADPKSEAGVIALYPARISVRTSGCRSSLLLG